MARHKDGFHPLAQRVRIYLRRRNIGMTGISWTANKYAPPRRNLLDGEIDAPSLFLPWMARHKDGFHPLARHVRIYLRRRNIGMTEHLLDGQ